jgi:hypothetical protein
MVTARMRLMSITCGCRASWRFRRTMRRLTMMLDERVAHVSSAGEPLRVSQSQLDGFLLCGVAGRANHPAQSRSGRPTGDSAPPLWARGRPLAPVDTACRYQHDRGQRFYPRRRTLRCSADELGISSQAVLSDDQSRSPPPPAMIASMRLASSSANGRSAPSAAAIARPTSLRPRRSGKPAGSNRCSAIIGA